MDIIELLSKKFWPNIRKTESCWWWTGPKNLKGYGYVRLGPLLKLAHRLSYTLHKGQIPEGLLVMHSCDEPSCVNPEHLSVGTHMDNYRDSTNKGRQWHQVPEIREKRRKHLRVQPNDPRWDDPG